MLFITQPDLNEKINWQVYKLGFTVIKKERRQRGPVKLLNGPHAHWDWLRLAR